MKIYTKTGDDGRTGLLGPGRVGKDDPRIEAYGTVDELNAALGVVLAEVQGARVIDCLTRIQEDLFLVGAALADPRPNGRFHSAVTISLITMIEEFIDELDAALPPLTKFLLPGGTPAAAHLHLARTICRRAERKVITLAHTPGQHVSDNLCIYLNRLSDLLFVLARTVNYQAGVAETPWRGL